MKYSFIVLFFSSFVNAQIDSVSFEQSKVTKPEFIEAIKEKEIVLKQPTDSNIHQLLSENCILYLHNVSFANSFFGTILHLDKEEKNMSSGFYARVSNTLEHSNRLIKLKRKDCRKLQNLMAYTKPDSTFFKVRSSSVHRFVELIVWYKNEEIVGGIYLTGLPKFSEAIINKNYFLKLRELILQLNPPKRL